MQATSGEVECGTRMWGVSITRIAIWSSATIIGDRRDAFRFCDGFHCKLARCRVALQHRSEKCVAVFGQTDAKIKEIERRSESMRTSGALGGVPLVGCWLRTQQSMRG